MSPMSGPGRGAGTAPRAVPEKLRGGPGATCRFLARRASDFKDICSRPALGRGHLYLYHCCRVRVAGVGAKKSLPIIKVEVGPIEWAGGGSGTTLCRSPKPCSHAELADTIVLEPFGRVPGKV